MDNIQLLRNLTYLHLYLFPCCFENHNFFFLKKKEKNNDVFSLTTTDGNSYLIVLPFFFRWYSLFILYRTDYLTNFIFVFSSKNTPLSLSPMFISNIFEVCFILDLWSNKYGIAFSYILIIYTILNAFLSFYCCCCCCCFCFSVFLFTFLFWIIHIDWFSTFIHTQHVSFLQFCYCIVYDWFHLYCYVYILLLLVNVFFCCLERYSTHKKKKTFSIILSMRLVLETKQNKMCVSYVLFTPL